jgi:excisionase family DNA binding protein
MDILEKNPWLDPVAAADALGVSVKTLALWRSTGRYALPYYKIGRKIRYKRADLQTWVEARARTSTA